MQKAIIPIILHTFGVQIGYRYGTFRAAWSSELLGNSTDQSWLVEELLNKVTAICRPHCLVYLPILVTATKLPHTTQKP